jgi:hypothetical protein
MYNYFKVNRTDANLKCKMPTAAHCHRKKTEWYFPCDFR